MINVIMHLILSLLLKYGKKQIRSQNIFFEKCNFEIVLKIGQKNNFCM